MDARQYLYPPGHQPETGGAIPAHIARAVTDALHAVDLDIEQHGAVSAETVDKVRAARILLG